MGIIKFSLFLFNIIGWLIADIYLWTFSWCPGVGGLLALIGFFVGYSISGGMTIAPRDYWKLPDYEVFRKKLRYGNSIAGAVTAISVFVLFVIKTMMDSYYYDEKGYRQGAVQGYTFDGEKVCEMKTKIKRR